MPVSSEISVAGPFTPNGVTRSFSFAFKAASAGEVVAVDADGLTISSALYSVTLDDDEGGTLTFGVAPALADYPAIYIVSEPALTQPSDFDNAGPSFNPAALTRAIDRSAIRDLKQQREIDRALKVGFGESGFSLPSAAGRLNKFLSFDATGNLLMSSGTGADAGLRDDLATNGDSLVGVGSAALGDVVPVTPQQYGSSPSVDSADALSDAANAAAAADGELVINGTIRVDTPVTLPGNLKISGNGIIDLSNATPVTVGDIERVLTVGTGVTQIADLSADITLFGTTATFASPHGLAVSDVFAVWNPTDFSQAPFRDIYRAGDMFRVAEVISTTQVRFFGVSKSLYDKDDVEVYKLNGGSLAWDGVKIIPPATGIPLLLDGLVDVNFTSPLVEIGSVGAAIEVHRCYGVSAILPRGTVLGTTDLYPMIISNSQNVVIQAVNNIYSDWHCISLGGRDGPATVPTADVLISGVIAKNNASSGVGAIEAHGGCKRVTYDNFMVDVANVSSEEMTFRNCTIYGRPPALFADGNCVFASEVLGGVYTFENCEMISAGDGQTFGSHLHFDISQITKPFKFVGRNLTCRNVGASPATASLLQFAVGSSAPAGQTIDIDIDGIAYVGSAPPAAAVDISGTNDVSALTTVRINNQSGLDTLYQAQATANYSIAMYGPGSRPGLTVFGDVSATLARDSTEFLKFETTLTADRTVTLPAAAASVTGDEFVVSRECSGAFQLLVKSGSTVIAVVQPYQWVRVAFRGIGGVGVWEVVESGALSPLAGISTFGDVAAFLELTRSSEFLARQTNVWSTTLTADRAVTFDSGALAGDVLRFVRPAAGAFNLNIGTGPIKALAAGQWCEITYNGSAWVLTAFGSL